eukprot:6620044-Prymnesium_polylepis.1
MNTANGPQRPEHEARPRGARGTRSLRPNCVLLADTYVFVSVLELLKSLQTVGAIVCWLGSLRSRRVVALSRIRQSVLLPPRGCSRCGQQSPEKAGSTGIVRSRQKCFTEA